MTDLKTISVYDSQIDSYVDLINKQPIDAILLSFIKRLETNSYVLDLGCGPAISSATMRDHGLRVDPTDASEEMVKLANSNFDIGARQALFKDINVENIYDGVWANFSLLHASANDFPTILKSLHRALKQRGVFHIGMKIGQGSKRDKLDRYYSYYSEEELRHHLNNAGFIVDSVEFGEALGLAGDLEPWIAVTSLKTI